MAALLSQSAQVKYLTTGDQLEVEDFVRLYECFEEGSWKRKKIKGSSDRKASRSPCTLLRNPLHREDNLYGYQAMWLMQNGPVPVDMTISHMCVTEKKKKGNKVKNVNPCVNVEHMRLEDSSTNSKRGKIQLQLVHQKVDWQRKKENKGYEGPLFMTAEGTITKKDNGVDEHACFTNCGVIKEFTGFHVHSKTRRMRFFLRQL